jgi:glucosamine--fructose-6-phosphate aminotransferase (isomerizing)
VDVEYASEYSVRGGPEVSAQRRPSVLVLSQSGETSDTLAALREAVRRGQKTLAITNATDSTMAREAVVSMPLAAGVERAIPATKSFTCQLAVLYLLALYEGSRLGRMDAAALACHIRDLRAQSDSIEAQLDGWREQMAGLAHKYRSASTFLYLGRGIHYAIAREGALKLKEASYVHAEGYPAGELKHGPNALVSDSVPLVVLATVDRDLPASVVRYERTLQLLADMKAQGARVIALGNIGDVEVEKLVSDFVPVQPGDEYLLPISEVVPLQLFSYFMALEHRVDVDRPRNLSKAVVEGYRTIRACFKNAASCQDTTSAVPRGKQSRRRLFRSNISRLELSCFPRSQKRDLDHPPQAVRGLALRCRSFHSESDLSSA